MGANMPILTGGKYKRRKFLCLPSIRPSTSRVREAMFNILKSYQLPKDFVFVDLCCGSGSVAAEAISRGAGKVILVDINDKHLQLAKHNMASINESNKATFLNCDITRNIPINTECDLIFLDPPYDKCEYIIDKTLNTLYNSNLLKPETILVVEASKKSTIPIKEHINILEARKYGATKIVIMQLMKR